MATETANIVYLTNTASEVKILPKTISTAVIHKKSDGTQTTIAEELSSKADLIHSHDDLYYTQSLIDGMLANKADRSEVSVEQDTITQTASGKTSVSLTVTLNAMSVGDWWIVPFKFTLKLTSATAKVRGTAKCYVNCPASGTYEIVTDSKTTWSYYRNDYYEVDDKPEYYTVAESGSKTISSGTTFSGGSTLFSLSQTSYGTVEVSGAFSIRRTA